MLSNALLFSCVPDTVIPGSRDRSPCCYQPATQNSSYHRPLQATSAAAGALQDPPAGQWLDLNASRSCSSLSTFCDTATPAANLSLANRTLLLRPRLSWGQDVEPWWWLLVTSSGGAALPGPPSLPHIVLLCVLPVLGRA